MSINFKSFQVSLWSATILALTFTVLSSFSTNAQTIKAHYLDGRLWVKFKNNYNYAHLTNRKGQIDIKKIPIDPHWILKYQITEFNQSFHFAENPELTQVYEIVFSNIYMVNDLLKDLNKLSSVDYAEPKPYVKTSYIPNDPYYYPTGQVSYGGPFNWKWPLEQINAESAWQYTTGDPDIKIAIVDDAVWTSHPDLTNKIVGQYNSVEQTYDCNPPTSINGWEKKFSHGTHVAGLAAAETNNGIGIASIGYDVSIIGVRITNNSGHLTHAYEGTSWAANNGADVINMSWGGGGFSQTSQIIMDDAHANGILLLAASGNSNNHYSHYPSAYNNVISVASLDQDLKKSGFSNYGASVDLCAPGGKSVDYQGWGILSSVPFDHPYDSIAEVYGKYENYQGTSMATPIVSGLCGLLLSYDPTVTAAEVDTCLRTTADNIDSQNPYYINKLGAGKVNAGAAMACIVSKVLQPIPDFLAYPTQANTNDPVTFLDYTVGTPTSWNWQFPGGSPSSSNQEYPPNIYYSQPGFYDVTLTSTNANGTNTITKTNYIEIISPNTPKADFSASSISITEGDQITFTDLSTQNTSWSWQFYGGSPSTSTSQGPHSILYNNPGSYDVRLIVSNAYGIDTLYKTNYITVNPIVKPQADFYGSTQNISVGSNNNYWDISTNNPSLWKWTFPGGTPSVSNNQVPTGIIYNSPGVYDVGLIACNSAGCDTIVKHAYISVHSGNATSKPIIDIFASLNLIPVGDSIQVIQTQYAAPNIQITNSYYEFPGGNPPNAINNIPNYIIYNTPGSYDIKAIACNAAGCDTVIKKDHVNVYGPGFSIHPCDTLFHFDGLNKVVNTVDSNNFTFGFDYDEYNLPPRFLEQIELWAIPNTWWAITDQNPDIYFELSDNNGNLIHKSEIIKDQHPPVSWPIYHLLYDMYYTVHFWEDDLLIDDDLGALSFLAHSQNTLVSDGTTTYEWDFTQNGISTYWRYKSDYSPIDTNRYISATSNFNPPGQASDWITFGPLTIPAGGAKLYWEHRYPDNNYRGAYEVLVSKTGLDINDFTTSGDTLKNIYDNDSETTWDTQWTPMEVDLNPTTYGNETVHFAIHHKGNDQYFFQIDNILLKDCNSSSVNISNNNITAKVNVFPNPFTDQTSVFFASDQSSDFQIDIFDITGKHIISREEKTNLKVLINRNGLNAGIYILKANDGYHSFNKKLIIK